MSESDGVSADVQQTPAPLTAMEKLFGKMVDKSEEPTNQLVRTFEFVKGELSRLREQEIGINEDPIKW